MSSHVYNLREIREYSGGLNTPDYMMRLRMFLQDQKWKIKYSQANIIKAYQKGIHLNFRPELVITFRERGDSVIIEVHHYAKVKVALAIVAGIVTSGITALVGVGTITLHIIDAKKFVRRIWQEIELMTKNSQPKILERTGFDEVTTTTTTVPAGMPPPVPPKESQVEVVVQQESIEVPHPQYTSSPYVTHMTNSPNIVPPTYSQYTYPGHHTTM